MKLHVQHNHIKSSRLYHLRQEYQDDYQPPNEDIPHLAKIRNIQNIRALAAEAEYISSKVRFYKVKTEFEQLNIHILGKLNEIQTCRDHGRQRLTSDCQDVSDLRAWHSSEKKMNKKVDDHHQQLIESRQTMQQSEMVMRQNEVNNLVAGRRLSKFDEIVKILNEQT